MAQTTSVSVVTGAFPTTAPSGLSSNVVAADGPNCDVSLRVTAGTGTVTLCGYSAKMARYLPIGDISLDSSVTGGMAHGRFSPGWGQFTYYLVWEKTAGATIATCHITTDVAR